MSPSENKGFLNLVFLGSYRKIVAFCSIAIATLILHESGLDETEFRPRIS